MLGTLGIFGRESSFPFPTAEASFVFLLLVALLFLPSAADCEEVRATAGPSGTPLDPLEGLEGLEEENRR